ncbi:MAG: endopeptidase La [Leptospiraceae bacterium]|nr:endopeptidase La [Leptospiraceae bacterium]MCP5494213.1 endopeptidase La [Leptospiraceae bacterium]
MSEEEFITPENETEHASNNDLVVVSEVLPDNLIVLPILDRPIFPGIVMPLIFSGEKSINAIKSAVESQTNIFGVVLVRDLNEQDIFSSSFYTVGTALKIYKVIPISEDTIQVVAQGTHRFQFIRTHSLTPILKWEVKYHYEPNTKPDEELRAYAMAVMSSAKSLLKLNPLFQEQLKMLLANINFEKPGYIMDLIASVLTSESAKLQSIIEAFDLYERGKTLLLYLKEEIEVHKLQEKITKQIDEKMAKQQKDFFLREQLKIIKKELGIEKDDKSSEIEKLEGRLKNLVLPNEAEKVIQSELDKLKMLEPVSPEYNVVRTYLDVLTQLPWGVYSEDVKDISHARQVLNDDHYGLDDVKSRILEFISTIIKRGKLTGSNILLVGPPGVGKTSVGKSIASALGRKFYRFSLGGMRDEAEIKGHRRTYIGAMPGKLIESIKRAGTSNPVIMLDEIDKIGKSFQGDPASAMLEVLDPEQNQNFLDHYLDVRFDLSNVLFVATANQLDTIPLPLLDRMEIIRLSGYILEEKTQIAKKYLLPRQLENHGLTVDELDITDGALVKIIDRYAREAGVRNLENQIKKIMRKATLKSVEGENGKIVITSANVEEFLGKEIFSTEELYNKGVPGVTLGLAYTALGGTTLYIEANAIHGKSSGFKQTGQLGDVMRESSEIAYSYIRSIIGKDESLKNFFDENFIHLHVPAGATPKDGPSAGITMALALHSLATQRIVRSDIAMTGELTLTGKVLPIGGVREKTIAARRVGIFELILPKENQKDFDELPSYIRDGIKIHFVDYFRDVLDIAYVT